MKKFVLMFALLFATLQVAAQNPVTITDDVKVNGSNGSIEFYAEIANGFYMYSTDVPKGGPKPTSIRILEIEGAELVGGLVALDEPSSKFDQTFYMQLNYFEEFATFEQKFKITAPDYRIKGFMSYQSCSSMGCNSGSYEFEVSGKSDVVAVATAPVASAVEKDAAVATTTSVAKEAPVASVNSNAVSAQATESIDTWAPVEMEKESGDGSIWLTFALGFGGGLLALLTPCVWPIIPMTVSFFLKRAKERRTAVKEAFIYGASIIVIYLTLGIAVTLLFGPAALNDLATNPYFNVFFFLMLVVFGASFLGGFDIKLPSSWTNKVDSKASSATGLLSIFLMAFTLTLVSFSCTGPIIGFLLVEATTSGDLFGPAMGMFGFALALALPFTLFAIFPSLLKQAPRSGGWMNTIKVVLGFVEIAFALKFLSVADLTQGWGILDRETFLVLWIALFALLGLYLLKIIRFPHDDPEDKTTTVSGFFMALVSLAFALYMVPGLWGAPCKAISAFAPPMSTQDFNLYSKTFEPSTHDYDEAVRMSREQGKPILLDFTGHGCVNCREMEALVLSEASVLEILSDDFIVASLYVDDDTMLPEPFVGRDGSTCYTVGQKWTHLQQHKFGGLIQPFYVIVDSDGRPLTGSFGFEKNVGSFVDFLQDGIKKFEK